MEDEEEEEEEEEEEVAEACRRMDIFEGVKVPEVAGKRIPADDDDDDENDDEDAGGCKCRPARENDGREGKEEAGEAEEEEEAARLSKCLFPVKDDFDAGARES